MASPPFAGAQLQQSRSLPSLRSYRVGRGVRVPPDSLAQEVGKLTAIVKRRLSESSSRGQTEGGGLQRRLTDGGGSTSSSSEAVATTPSRAFARRGLQLGTQLQPQPLLRAPANDARGYSALSALLRRGPAITATAQHGLGGSSPLAEGRRRMRMLKQRPENRRQLRPLQVPASCGTSLHGTKGKTSTATQPVLGSAEGRPATRKECQSALSSPAVTPTDEPDTQARSLVTPPPAGDDNDASGSGGGAASTSAATVATAHTAVAAPSPSPMLHAEGAFESCSNGEQQPRSSSDALIIIDWDDTLLATSRLCHQFGVNGARTAPLPPKLCRHLQLLARDVIEVLRVARGLSDHVTIVTNAAQGWVQESGRRFVPSVVDQIQEWCIPVVSAQIYAARCPSGDPTDWKKKAFSKLLKKVVSSGPTTMRSWQPPPPRQIQLISIGDSEFEREAARAVGGCGSRRAAGGGGGGGGGDGGCRPGRWETHECAGGSEPPAVNVVTQTVKLMGAPTIKQLRQQLQLLALQLEPIVRSGRELDLEMGQ
eukprot:COSAG01_NODE_2176_length_8220_cov_15.093215_4_plen_539_part_00